jgi:glutamyl-tRNA synthetase
LASVVDDYDFQITHVVRAIEHLSNTPRQIFIAQALGYPLPEYAHIPFVAEPGSKTKMSKRKIAQYLKNPDFKKMLDHGMAIAQRIGKTITPESFNPVLVDFYKTVGYLPDAINNYLLLLGWSLDDRTEEFSREEMIRLFSLERVVKSEASFDPQKLLSFQARYMSRLPVKQKVPLVIPYLQAAGLVADPIPCELGETVTAVVTAAGDRLVVAGDILQFDDFFLSDNALPIDPKAFEKRITKADKSEFLLNEFRKVLSAVEPFDPAMLEQALHGFCETQQIQAGEIVHALRVAVTGKAVGFGLFDTLAILGRERCLRRIQFTLERKQASSV